MQKYKVLAPNVRDAYVLSYQLIPDTMGGSPPPDLTPIMGGYPPRIKNGDLHEMGLQTSYRQKKTTILPHFSRPESWYHSFPQIMNIKPSKFVFQTFKIRFSDLRNSLFRPSKFALQGFKIRASRLDT